MIHPVYIMLFTQVNVQQLYWRNTYHLVDFNVGMKTAFSLATYQIWYEKYLINTVTCLILQSVS